MVDSTLTLLARAQAGDAEALNALIARFLPRLQRWATGRLPGWARDLADTHDLVQETVVQAFRKIEKFEVHGEGALQAYLRQATSGGQTPVVRLSISFSGRLDGDRRLFAEASESWPRPQGTLYVLDHRQGRPEGHYCWFAPLGPANTRTSTAVK